MSCSAAIPRRNWIGNRAANHVLISPAAAEAGITATVMPTAVMTTATVTIPATGAAIAAAITTTSVARPVPKAAPASPAAVGGVVRITDGGPAAGAVAAHIAP
jgi:hypothetical protein